ncbi:MAG TPA: hypothetical protein EYM49_00140 [Campylobacterales bacterium]|nr:hypothetical protein [Campylobacterales bacterium]
MKTLYKQLFFILITTIILFSDTVNFKEGKYVEALDIFTYRDGNISYESNQTIIHYKDGKTIIKSDDNLTVHNKKGELLTTINLNERADISLYFKLTKALFSKNFETLKENFEIKELKDKKYLFNPKDEVKNIITTLELSLNSDETPKEFILNFNNGDIVKIETK